MTSLVALAIAASVAPLAVFVLRAVTGRALKKVIPYISMALVTVSLALAAYLAYAVVFAPMPAAPAYAHIDWLVVGGANPIGFSVYVDPLSALMLLVVMIVAWCVQVYSLSYMGGDRRLENYYAFLSLFTVSMAGLVISANLLMTFFFWELVGLCSYLLIGFWFDRDAASRAAVKAFIVTRLGDLGFLIGIALLLARTGTLDIVELSHLCVPAGVATAAAVLLFVGAMGKSAQFPLHVWLPDAMEGPTPVSALIHAATMVAAGVYLLARNFYLYAGTEARGFVLAVGVVTALMAAAMAIFQRDVKKVLAFSTISQLGYMMAALGAGDQAVGMFHLTTHAFFKALLFLAAGAVFHAVHSLDIFEMGGLARRMPVTAALFGVGALSLAGFPGTGGFFSKDAVLHALEKSGPAWVYDAMLAGAFVTAFYIFRVYFRVFFGEPGKVFEEVHEADARMTVPMGILAVLSFAAVGLTSFSPLRSVFEEGLSVSGALTGSAVALAGIALAFVLYGPRRRELERLKGTAFAAVRDALEHRLYIDDFYEAVFVKGYDLAAAVGRWFDERVVDGVVNGVAAAAVAVGDRARRLQNGSPQYYLLTSLALVLLFGYLYFFAGWGIR